MRMMTRLVSQHLAIGCRLLAAATLLRASSRRLVPRSKRIPSVLVRATAMLLLTATCSPAQTNALVGTNRPGDPKADAATSNAGLRAERAEQMRTSCIQGRRHLCGRILQVLPQGLVVDSGYSTLLLPPFNQSWVLPDNISVKRDPTASEQKTPGSICIGAVLLTHYPKRPAVKIYDYVAIQAYPAGEFTYSPMKGVKKTVRRFSASLEAAIALNLADEK